MDTNLFRAIPAAGGTPPIVGEVSTVGFSLEFKDAGTWSGQATNQWLPLEWRQLVEYHGSRAHVNFMSANGDDFYHVHPEYTSFVVQPAQTSLGAPHA